MFSLVFCELVGVKAKGQGWRWNLFCSRYHIQTVDAFTVASVVFATDEKLINVLYIFIRLFIPRRSGHFQEINSHDSHGS